MSDARAWLALVVVLGLGCAGHDDLPACLAHTDCAAEEVCQFGANVCLPLPDPGGTCADDYRLDTCATASCTACADCIAACVPRWRDYAN